MNQSEREIKQMLFTKEETLIQNAVQAFEVYIKDIYKRLDRLEAQAAPPNRYETPKYIVPRKNDVVIYQQYKDLDPVFAVGDGQTHYETSKVLHLFRFCEGEMRDMAKRSDK